MDPAPNDPASAETTEWFREPTRREHLIATGLFLAFGLFFIALFVVLAGWWFRWVVLILGLYSILHGFGHARRARQAKKVGL